LDIHSKQGPEFKEQAQSLHVIFEKHKSGLPQRIIFLGSTLSVGVPGKSGAWLPSPSLTGRSEKPTQSSGTPEASTVKCHTWQHNQIPESYYRNCGNISSTWT
jgi:hypothetical protein